MRARVLSSGKKKNNNNNSFRYRYHRGRAFVVSAARTLVHITHPSCAVRVVSFCHFAFFSVVRKIRDFRPGRVGLCSSRIYNLTKTRLRQCARAFILCCVIIIMCGAACGDQHAKTMMLAASAQQQPLRRR